MKRLVTLTAALALLSGAANAADLSGSMKDGGGVLPAAVNWSGLYAGVNGGYVWQDTSDIGNNWLFGGQVGLNLQRGNLVGGIETDLGMLTSNGNVYIGTVRGRAGLAVSNWLFYGTGGYAYAGSSCTGCFADGWTVGTGVEYKISQHWSVKTEYLHTELGTDGGNLPPIDAVRLGVNFVVAPFDQLH